ncbi:nitrite reductase small subunit NirD [Agromyces archimandritae]|uniref:Nitrite reductase small subunit NirD n=1 Tax=Agromyces archimandritae TaxID=2781962 RepID=A0A975FMZ6_9MICO|nr:nitrite reductase small subunit NirD [Agromyces archimandritae]QTX04483.1 nitrite reductase small subunit NirD [Agromyces archimandritae]
MTVTATRTAWRAVCPVDELEPAWGEVALLGERQIALFRIGPAEVYAVDHLDPRTGAPVMARGIVGSKRDRPTIASPLHKEVYDLGTGECYTAPDYRLGTYRTRVVDGGIEVELGVAR